MIIVYNKSVTAHTSTKDTSTEHIFELRFAISAIKWMASPGIKAPRCSCNVDFTEPQEQQAPKQHPAFDVYSFIFGICMHISTLALIDFKKP